MISTKERRFSCLECPVRLTGLKSLKRHYFEKHGLVPIVNGLPITDEVFGLPRVQ